MDKTDQLQFATANILVGDRLITDFPTEIGTSHITLNSYGAIPVANIRYIKIQRHKDWAIERYGSNTVTRKMLLDWPVVIGRLVKPEKRSIEEQTRAGKVLIEILKERKQKVRRKLLEKDLRQYYAIKKNKQVETSLCQPIRNNVNLANVPNVASWVQLRNKPLSADQK